MRNKLIYGLLAIALVFTSCSEDYYDSNFPSDAETGWIQFASANQRTTVNDSPDVTIRVNYEVPVNRQDVTYSYSVELIAGQANVEEGTFSVVIPANTRDAAFTYTVDVDVEDEYEVRFTLLSVDNPKVSVGIEEDVPTSMVLTVAFPSIFPEGTWLTDSVVCVGNGSGGCSDNPANNDIPLSYSVELTSGDTASEFNISDITGGLYALGYDAADNAVTVNIIFDGQLLAVVDQPDTTYGGDIFNGEGSYTLGADGLVDGFELTWSNGWGDAGETTFTR
jgi:hypothetical protein